MALVGVSSARSDDDLTVPWREISLGADIGRDAWSFYSTQTLAPFGAITEDGVRLRLSSGYGRYRYVGPGDIARRGQSTYLDLLAGYQMHVGMLTAKLLAGGSASGHAISPYDDENSVRGVGWGARVQLELWLTLSAEAWLALDTGWAYAFQSHAHRVRLGHRVGERWSVGLDLSAFGNEEGVSGRAGALLRYELDDGELAVTAGVAMPLAQGQDVWDLAPFVLVSWVKRY